MRSSSLAGVSHDQARRAIRRWAEDPILWMKDCLGETGLWERQVEIVRAVVKFRETNVHTGNAIGKDYVTARICLWWLYTRKNALVVTTATKKEQVNLVLWGEIRDAYRRARVHLAGVLQPAATELRIGEKWYMVGMVAREQNAFAGLHSDYVLGVQDEAAGLAPFVDQAMMGLCSNDHDRILRIGNPLCGPEHPFAKACAAGTIRGVTTAIRVSSRETPNHVEGKTVIPGLAGRMMVAAFERKHGKDSFITRARVDGIFPGAAADGLISLEHLAAARQRLSAGVVAQDQDTVTLGCDVARYGDDLTRIRAVRGPETWEVPQSPLTKADGVQIARALAAAIRETGAWAVSIDGGGLGAGTLDAIRVLREVGEFPAECIVYDVQFGAGSETPDDFANVRAELWWRMKDWIWRVGAFDADERLEEELLAHRYKIKDRGTALIIEPKEDVKERLDGRSPDDADALALAVSGHEVGDVVLGYMPEPEDPRAMLSQDEEDPERDPWKRSRPNKPPGW